MDDLWKIITNNVDRNLLELFAKRLDIPHDNLKFVPTPLLKRAVINGNTNHIDHNLIAIVSRRYNLLWNHKYSSLFSDLYQVNDNEMIKLAVAYDHPHPMETIILNMDSYSLDHIINIFGIFKFRPIDKQYIRDNIISYAGILKRGHMETIPLEVMKFMDSRDLITYLHKLTDKEIFADIGAYVPYTDRNELVLNIANCIYNRQFMFIPVRSLTRSINKMTTVGLTCVTATDVLMLCYGTPLKYITYELYDLIESFRNNNSGSIVEFSHPEDKNKKFTLNDIEGLKNLLKCYETNSDITDLLNIIRTGFDDVEKDIDHDYIARKQLYAFDKNTRDYIREFLREIFYTGMYMRQWSGPGNPYPLKMETTKTGINPDEKVASHIGTCLELLNKMGVLGKKFCFDLKICAYTSDKNIDNRYGSFINEWKLVIKGEQCIRIASRKFVGTGYHYLRSLFMETIPGVDVKIIDKIF